MLQGQGQWKGKGNIKAIEVKGQGLLQFYWSEMYNFYNLWPICLKLRSQWPWKNHQIIDKILNILIS